MREHSGSGAIMLRALCPRLFWRQKSEGGDRARGLKTDPFPASKTKDFPRPRRAQRTVSEKCFLNPKPGPRPDPDPGSCCDPYMRIRGELQNGVRAWTAWPRASGHGPRPRIPPDMTCNFTITGDPPLVNICLTVDPSQKNAQPIHRPQNFQIGGRLGAGRRAGRRPGGIAGRPAGGPAGQSRLAGGPAGGPAG